MTCSKIFSGDLPELTNEIIQYFKNDNKTLYSCILVNRLWCRLAQGCGSTVVRVKFSTSTVLGLVQLVLSTSGIRTLQSGSTLVRIEFSTN